MTREGLVCWSFVFTENYSKGSNSEKRGAGADNLMGGLEQTSIPTSDLRRDLLCDRILGDV
jgi:hypothetical protein